MAASMRAFLILVPPISVLVVLAARTLGRVAARNLSALARVQFACLPAAASGDGDELSAAVERKSAIVLQVAAYRKEKEEEECVVCLSGIEEGDEIRELKCRHLFHRSCLDRWLARPVAATCPLCRCRLLTPPAEEMMEEDEESSDMMLFMACVHGRTTWLWPSSSS